MRYSNELAPDSEKTPTGHCVEYGPDGWVDISTRPTSEVRRAHGLCWSCPLQDHCERQLAHRLENQEPPVDQLYAGFFFDKHGRPIAGRKYIGRPKSTPATRKPGRHGAA